MSLKNNRGNQLVMNNHHTKFEVHRPQHSSVIERNQFLPPMFQFDIDLLPFDPKSKGVIYLPWLMHLQSLRAEGPCLAKILIGNSFYLHSQYDLDLWPHDPKINRDSSTCQDQRTYKVREPTVHNLSRYWPETVFTSKVNVTLTFDLLTKKSKGIIKWS
jgi:hypothetical protein